MPMVMTISKKIISRIQQLYLATTLAKFNVALPGHAALHYVIIIILIIVLYYTLNLLHDNTDDNYDYIIVMYTKMSQLM